MWTKREKAMLKAMAAAPPLKSNLFYHKEHGENRGDCLQCNQQMSAIRAAVRAACEINEPDYKAMWEELKDNSGNQKACLLEIERRHGGKHE